MATIYDPTQVRKNTNLPYLQNQNQPLELTNNAANAQQPGSPAQQAAGGAVPPVAGQDLNSQVLTKLQQNVLQGSNNPVMDQTEQLTQRILANPTSLGNPQDYVRQGMDQYNRTVANTLEQQRRQMAPTAGSGLTQRMLGDMAFRAAQGRADTQRGLENEVSQMNFADMLKAAAEGRATATTKGSLIQQGIQNLATARGAAEGAENRQAAKESQASDQTFQLNMQQMQNNWMTSERMDSQTFQSQMAKLNADLAEAAAKGDFERARTLQQDALATQLKMQTQGFQQEEKMAYLNSQLEEARAAGNYEREIGIRRFEHMQNLDTLQRQFGHEAAMAELDQQKALALQNNDFANMSALNAVEFEFRAAEAAKDRAMQNIGYQLQERGLDMQEQFQEWNRIQDAIDAGQIGPEAGLDYMRQALDGTGIRVVKPNAIQEAIASATTEMLAEKAQFATAQPQYILKDASGQPVVDSVTGAPMLTTEGENAWSQYTTRTYYSPEVQTGDKGKNGWSASGSVVGSVIGGVPGALIGGIKGLFGL